MHDIMKNEPVNIEKLLAFKKAKNEYEGKFHSLFHQTKLPHPPFAPTITTTNLT